MSRARVSNPLADPVRLTALRGTGLLGSPHDEAFDRLAGLARKILRAPVGMVSLLDDRHLHVKSCVGLPDLAKAGRVPATESFCQHVVITEQPLVVDDAREHELTRGLAVVKSGMALAYAGVPLALPGGAVLGTLSVSDPAPRAWRPEEIEILRDLAASVLTEIEMRADIEARRQAEADLQRSTDRLRGLMDNSPTVIFAKDLDGRYLFINQAGEPYGVCGISTDITERIHAERALREAQQRFVSAFEHAPTGMAMAGTDGRYRQVNDALCELTGRGEDELLRMSLADTILPEEWAAHDGPFERLLAGSDGEPRRVLVNVTALTDAEGRPSELFVQFQDITEQTRGHDLPAVRHHEKAKTDLDLGVLRQLTAETGGEQNPQLIRDLAGVFREDSRRGLEQVADALRQKDAHGVARAAHALKGSSGQLGASRTEAISAELQAVAESGELKDAKALLRRLETAVDAAQSALSSALPEGTAE